MKKIKVLRKRIVNCQVDFEFVQFKDSKPTEWSKFSHGSSFLDAKNGIKAVNHKLLIRAIVGSNSIREDIIIATPTSQPEKITISRSKIHEIPKMLKFSVGKGIRIAYKPMMDINNETISIDGKQVYKEIPSKESIYKTNIREIFKLIFKQDADDIDIENFNSFIGIITLMKKYLSNEAIQRTHDRYIDLLWGFTQQRGQELEVKDPKLDFQIKNSAYQILIKELKIKDISENYVEMYYMDYGKRLRKSFRNYLVDLGYF